jgi:hypothetical protein
MSDSTLGSALAFLVLIPLGIVHVAIAARMYAKEFIPSNRTRLTGALAVGCFLAGLCATLWGGDLTFEGPRWIVAGLSCVPALPTGVELARQRSWGALAMAAIVPAAGVALILA